MKPGEVIYTTHIRASFPGMTFDYSAGKKDYFVFILLGVEPKDGSKPLDPIKRLNELGWELVEKRNYEPDADAG